MKKTLIYTACVVALSSSNALAQSEGIGELQGCVAAPEDKVTNVYFGNGVGNSPTEANVSRSYLVAYYKSMLESLGSDSGTFNFATAYNSSLNPFYDVVEVLSQKSAEVGARQWLNGLQILRLVQGSLDRAAFITRVKAVIAAATGAGIPAINNVMAQLYDFAADEIVKAKAKALKSIPADQSNHVTYYSADLLAGKRVFVVAHSQGNLFANSSLAATARIRPGQVSSLAMVGVATPAARQFRDSFYRTAHDDVVINSLRFIETVLSSNINNDLDDDRRSFSNHRFLSDYMADGLPSRKDIDIELKRLAATVPFPTRQAGEGAIRATLTWDAQPDVDLHAFEPSGSHVYYSNRRGSSGFLDVDDVTSFGPENYFVACNKIELGTYRIGVNYFRGRAPSTATVSLFLGDGRIPSPKTLTLPIARGAAGNGSPQILFTIQVTENVDPQTQKRSAVYTVQ